MKKFLISFLLSTFLVSVFAQTTSVLFSMTGLTGSAHNRTITITPDVLNNPLWLSTNLVDTDPFPIYPVGGVVTTNLAPWGYTIQVDGWSRSIHIVVPASTNTLNVVSLINTNQYSPLQLFLNQLYPGANIAFVTNTDGSITISSAGGGGSVNLTNGFYTMLVTNQAGAIGVSISTNWADLSGSANAALISANAFSSSLTNALLSALALNLTASESYAAAQAGAVQGNLAALQNRVLTNYQAGATALGGPLTVSNGLITDKMVSALGDNFQYLAYVAPSLNHNANAYLGDVNGGYAGMYISVDNNASGSGTIGDSLGNVYNDGSGDMTAIGNITAANFIGDGIYLTTLSASQLTSGTVPLARMPVQAVTNNQPSLVTLTNLSALTIYGPSQNSGLILQGIGQVSTLFAGTDESGTIQIRNSGEFDIDGITFSTVSAGNLKCSVGSLGAANGYAVPIYSQAPTNLLAQSALLAYGTMWQSNGIGVTNFWMTVSNVTGTVTWLMH